MESTNERTILDSWNGLGYPEVSELIRSAFRDVYDRLGAGAYVEKTWAELKALRDEAGLSPGTYYRITDYVATTTQENTRSAGHAFDIIVIATAPDTLSEDALAILHEGDTYFSGAGARLGAWSLKYCLDNSPRFAWADAENGKGVIWWMRDEWGNEAPYDFKNIQFKRFPINGFSDNFKGNDEVKAALLYDPDDNPLYFGTTDVYGSEVPSGVEIGEDGIWAYTFTGVDTSSSLESPEYYDMSSIHKSLSQETIDACEDDGCGADTEDRVNGNVIKPRCEEFFEDDLYFKGRFVLNNIVFFGRYYDNGYDEGYSVAVCYANVFGAECRDCTFGNNCFQNSFGNSCYSNTFGNSCYNNTFGNYFRNNTFGNGCNYNTFGNDCYQNTFGNNFQYGTVFEGVTYVNVPGSSSPIKYCTILAGTQGTNGSNKLTINFVANKTYPQFAGKNTANSLKIWNPADLAE